MDETRRVDEELAEIYGEVVLPRQPSLSRRRRRGERRKQIASCGGFEIGIIAGSQKQS